MRRRRRIAALFLGVLLVSVAATAGARGVRQTAVETDTILIEEPWARPAPSAGGVSAAYFRITNTGSLTEFLVAAETPVAGTVELHTHIMDGDVARMRMVPRVELVPGETVEFRPGGLHVMLMDLKGPLPEGEEFMLTLLFEASPSIELPVEAQAPPITR